MADMFPFEGAKQTQEEAAGRLQTVRRGGPSAMDHRAGRPRQSGADFARDSGLLYSLFERTLRRAAEASSFHAAAHPESRGSALHFHRTGLDIDRRRDDSFDHQGSCGADASEDASGGCGAGGGRPRIGRRSGTAKHAFAGRHGRARASSGGIRVTRSRCKGRMARSTAWVADSVDCGAETGGADGGLAAGEAEAVGGDFDRLAKSGKVVMALGPKPSPPGTEGLKSPYLGPFNLLWLRAFLVGKTILGMRVDDTIRAVDWLVSRGDDGSQCHHGLWNRRDGRGGAARRGAGFAHQARW